MTPMHASTRPLPHPARAATTHTPIHSTRPMFRSCNGLHRTQSSTRGSLVAATSQSHLRNRDTFGSQCVPQKALCISAVLRQCCRACMNADVRCTHLLLYRLRAQVSLPDSMRGRMVTFDAYIDQRHVWCPHLGKSVSLGTNGRSRAF
jgi:hypothetical protein